MRRKTQVQIVITAPSRELATQLYQVAKQVAVFSNPEIRVTNFVGGTDKQRANQPFKQSTTPYRIWNSWSYF